MGVKILDLREIQKMKHDFEKARGWDKFSPALVFSHLIEELGEIADYILIEEKYKVPGLGHDSPDMKNLAREFAQAFNLFVQLANHYNIDLEKAILDEMKIMEKRFPADKWRKIMDNYK